MLELSYVMHFQLRIEMLLPFFSPRTISSHPLQIELRSGLLLGRACVGKGIHTMDAMSAKIYITILEADGNNLGNEGKGDYLICQQLYQIKYKFSKCHIRESRATAIRAEPRLHLGCTDWIKQ